MLPSGVRVMVLVGLCMVVLMWLPDSFREYSYNRQAIAHGQWWRLLSGNWVHFTAWHLFMNLGFMVLLTVLAGSMPIGAVVWIGLLICLSLGVGVGLWLTEPSLSIYAGASGVAQGMLAFVSVLCWSKNRLLAVLLLMMQWGRIVYEHTPFYNAHYLQAWIRVPVDPTAHVSGACTGAFFAIGYLMYQKYALRYRAFSA